MPTRKLESQGFGNVNAFIVNLPKFNFALVGHRTSLNWPIATKFTWRSSSPRQILWAPLSSRICCYWQILLGKISYEFWKSKESPGKLTRKFSLKNSVNTHHHLQVLQKTLQLKRPLQIPQPHQILRPLQTQSTLWFLASNPQWTSSMPSNEVTHDQWKTLHRTGFVNKHVFY